MLLHHYTSVNSLKSILENKSVRFKRLDKVDDPSEAILYPSRRFCQTLFTSSWTSSFDNSEMWEKYGNSGKGVIISMPNQMFNQYRVKSTPFFLIASELPAFSPLSESQLITENYVINPIVGWDNFMKKVNYVDDLGIIKKYLDKSIRYKNEYKNGNLSVSAVLDDVIEIARYKESKWRYQEEYRFLIQKYLFHTHPNLKFNIEHAMIDSLNYHFDEKYSCGVHDKRELDVFIDVPISGFGLSKMCISVTGDIEKENLEYLLYLKKYQNLNIKQLHG